MREPITPASMMNATVLNTFVTSDPGGALSIPVAAKADEAWVLRKIWASNDADGVTDFNNLASKIQVDVSFGGTPYWGTDLHPRSVGTSATEFDNGPWELDLDPGLYTGTKAQEMRVGIESFGTGIVSTIVLFYQ